MTTTTTNHPVDRVRIGSVEAAIWKGADANGNTRFNATVQRRYRDAEGNYKSTSSFGHRDLLIAAKVFDEVHTRIRQLYDEEFQARTAATSGSAAEAQGGAS